MLILYYLLLFDDIHDLILIILNKMYIIYFPIRGVYGDSLIT